MYGLVRVLGAACRSDEVFYQYFEDWCVGHKLARRRARVNLARQNIRDQNLFLWCFNRQSLGECEYVDHELHIPTQIDRRRHTAAGLTGAYLMDGLPCVINRDGADVLGIVITAEIDHSAVFPVTSDTGAGEELFTVRAVAADRALAS